MRLQPLDRSFLEAAAAQSLGRRRFLRAIAGTGAGAAVFGASAPLRAMLSAPAPKTIVVTFGGGARDQETFALEGQQYIPRVLAELIPQATFFTQVLNRGILGHYVATASLATGNYETFDNFAPVSPASPTIFEYFRRDLHRSSSDAWVIAPSNGFNRIGESHHASYGAGTGANVVLPKMLLRTGSGSSAPSQMARLLRDNYESSAMLSADGSQTAEMERLTRLMKLSLTDFRMHASTVSSPDELSLYLARHLMRELAPRLIWLTLHDIDVAHSGAFSLYTEAIQRSDGICADLWQTIQNDPEYKGRTNLFILPDFGRDGDNEVGGNGFQHHRTGDPLSRTTWLLALGPGIRENVVVDRPVESIDLVPTLAHLLGCNARFASGHLLTEVL